MKAPVPSLEFPERHAFTVTRLPLYARFVRMYIVDPPLAAMVGIAAGFGAVAPRAASVLKVLLLLAMCTVLVYVVHVLDDITGLKTGTDLKTALRKAKIGEPKLLATGVLSLGEARSVLLVLVAVAAGLAVPVLAFAPPRAVVAIILAIVIAGQYSSGARWSYHGLGELSVLLAYGALAVVPYVYLTGEFGSRILWIGLLVGLAIVLANFCSNFVDVEEDASTGRKSLVVLLGVQRTKILFTALVAGFWLLYATCWWRGVVPRAAAVVAALLPFHMLAVRYVWNDRPLEARRTCFTSNRLHAVFLTASLWVETLTR